MKVLFINLVYGIGSTGRIIADLAEIVECDGGTAKVFYGYFGDEVSDRSMRCSSYAEYVLHNGLSRLSDHAGSYSWFSTARMIREIECFSPDVIHLHTLHGFYVNCWMLFRYLKRANIPVVWTLHDCWAFTGHCTYYAQADCVQWRTGCRSCALLRRYPQCYLWGDVRHNYARKKKSFTGVDNLTLTVPSAWLQSQVEFSFLRHYPVKVIPNGVDLSVFCPQTSSLRVKYDLVDKQVVLGVANSWVDRKGFSDLIELSKRLGPDYKVVLIGLTDEQLISIPNCMLGIKRTSSQTELAQWYSLANVFVNPTYEETFGMTTVEAQACGAPVAAYRTSAVPETIADGNGYLVEPGNVDELEGTVQSIVGSGMRSDPTKMKVFDKNIVYKQYLKLYQTVRNR